MVGIYQAGRRSSTAPTCASGSFAAGGAKLGLTGLKSRPALRTNLFGRLAFFSCVSCVSWSIILLARALKVPK